MNDCEVATANSLTSRTIEDMEGKDNTRSKQERKEKVLKIIEEHNTNHKIKAATRPSELESRSTRARLDSPNDFAEVKWLSQNGTNRRQDRQAHVHR